MKMKMHTSFDKRPLALFAALALSAGLATAQAVFGPTAPPKPAPTAPAVKAPAAPAAPNAFQKADTDGNGSISRAEAKQAGGSVDKWFEQMDTNHDGVLSTAEFKLTRK